MSEGTTPAPSRDTGARDHSTHKRRRVVALAVAIGPLAVLVALMLLIIHVMKTGQYMNEPPKGAGAGHTGMYNEYMKSK